jgi:hypothetical protein
VGGQPIKFSIEEAHIVHPVLNELVEGHMTLQIRIFSIELPKPKDTKMDEESEPLEHIGIKDFRTLITNLKNRNFA